MNKEDHDERLQRPHRSNRRVFLEATSGSAFVLFVGGPASLLGTDFSLTSKLWGESAYGFDQASGVKQLDPEKESHVGMQSDSQDPKKTKVSRETFWVSKSKNEIAEWFCKRNEVEKKHIHGKDSQGNDSPCFTIVFDKDGSPFKSSRFVSNKGGYACSDEIGMNVAPNLTKIYHYHVIVKDKDTLDPGGGVRP